MTALATPRRSGWIPWVFVGGMLLVIAVNGVLIVLALTTFTGVTEGQAYDRGLAYNDVLAENARQAALGWQGEIRRAGDGSLAVAITDRDGRPVPGTLRGLLLRPLEGTTQPLVFTADGEGRFRAALPVPQPGQWEARLVMTGPAGREFDLRRRLVLP
ncbi:FixH family protein [Roseomonas sp. 18066]|uniref:FixH family protein n=1 Tax=Roseomonas sp. 18066 TaxID=2681412 RepID=UPI001357F5E9|nr:FixH family protein [Roseomonas sp. 18066]